MTQEAWRVRVCRADRRPFGAGVLLDRLRVLTCAHVVMDALGADPDAGPPAGQLRLEFPSMPGVYRLAEVMADGWVPRTADGRGDMAVLRLDQPVPEDLAPAALAPCGELADRTVRAYGHPTGLVEGVWALTRLVGYGGPGNEWVQMDGQTVTGRRVERGFSGAGAFDDQFGAVIGLVVAEDRQEANRVAWMIPIELVSRYLPVLAPLVNPARTVASGVARPAEPVVPERQLSPTEQGELCEKLMAVPGMRDRSARDLYIRALERQIGEPVIFQRQRDDRLDIWGLVDACLLRPGAVRALLEVLAGVHRRQGAVLDLEETVERLFPDLLLQHAERVELENLVVGVARMRVGTAFRRAIAPFPAATEERTDVALVIRYLETLDRRRGGPPQPLLVFVDDLAHQIGGPSSVAMHRWIDAVGDRLEVDRAGLRQLCAESERRRTESGRAFFLVQLQPDSVDPDRYLMSAWLQHGVHTERVMLRDDVPRTVPEVIAKIDDLLPLVPEHSATDIDELTIELILPRRLMGHPVDQWESDRHVFPRPLGIRYPVLVRSLERLGSRSLHDAWRRKSRWLSENGHRQDESALSCVGPAGSRDPKALYSELISDDRPVGLAMPFPPGPTEVPRGDEFAAGLAAGLPVIVWSQEPVDPAAFCALVRDVLAGEGILEMPRRLLWLRRNAVRTMDHTRQPPHLPIRIGLLWDDADRIPAPFRRPVRLQAPQ